MIVADEIARRSQAPVNPVPYRIQGLVPSPR